MRVLSVDPDSPLFGYVRPGYFVKSVNGQEIIDAIDFRFKTAEERVEIKFADRHGREFDFRLDNTEVADLGLTLEEGKIQVCDNDCIFCFVRQQPKGLRRMLYLKDEDYRLSFTHGNFVTLSNVTEKDFKRIIEQRLSPLYVSVHATDDTLRRCMLRNERLGPIVPRLRRLAKNGISIHTQVVLCPGVNDGVHLEKTINDLAELFPGVQTLAVVPVGLTKYRERLPKLRRYAPDEASRLIDYIEKKQGEFLGRFGSRFVWTADEFYVEAQRPFPNRVEYEDMAQFENGVGMAREFIANFNRRRASLKTVKSKKKVLFLTGYSALPMFEQDILPYVRTELGLKMDVMPIENEFWGASVTVSGLLTGQDLLRAANCVAGKYDVLVLPPNCLNFEELFLDNLTLKQFQATVEKTVVVGSYNLAETVREVFV